jgi:diacylglycerol kinase (ATP)
LSQPTPDPTTAKPDVPPAMAGTTRATLPRIVNAFINSVDGLKAGWQEAAFRQEVVLAVILVPVAFWVPVTPVERAALIASVLLVLVVELLNSSVEAAIDRISFDRHSLSKRAKDLGSAAVLVSLILCALVWALVLFPLFVR